MSSDLQAAPPAVAAIGLSGRFPGAANARELWSLVRDGVEAIRSLTVDELVQAGESPERLSDPAYVKASGVLSDIDKFDAAFFGLSPRDAAIFDPQHRLFLECAWHAFEDAGYVGERIAGRVAVFASCGAAEYLMHNLLTNRAMMESVGAWLVRHNGNDPNFLATRVSYELNLRGPSLNVQTACSSSLVAIHLACQSLLSGECDAALAGGATIAARQMVGYTYKQGEILSPDGHCRAFDAKAAGTVSSSAVGCVVLKRLDDALRDGDRVLAVIRGSAINNDGSEKVGYLAPSVDGQARVVAEAMAISGVEPEEVSYVEAHGTGTLIGDPIELAGLSRAFAARTSRRQYCAIGSLKTNIGHAGEAAGVCSFIKTALALGHRQIPPSLHYESPNPQFDFQESPFFVNNQLRAWTRPAGGARIAGITALGAGGTNAHVIVQEAPERPPVAPARATQLVVISAKTPTALDAASRNLAAHFRNNSTESLADSAYTLLEGRKPFPHRRAVVARSPSEAATALEVSDWKAVTSLPAPPSNVFMFPGGGAQYAGMGAELYASEPVYREAFDTCLTHVDVAKRAEIRELCLGPASDTGAARLEAPSVGLPALFAVEYAVAKLLIDWGIKPSAMIGHSAGEYAVACIAGVLDVADAIALVAKRGALFERLPEGGMLSVALSEPDARKVMTSELSLAALNAPSLSVLAGPLEPLAVMEQQLLARDIECARVHIRVAAHSSMLDPILEEFASFCSTITFRSPKIPFVSNASGTWIGDHEATDPRYWVHHLRSTVRFGDGLHEVLSREAKGGYALVEVGPGRTLSAFARKQVQKPVVVTPTLRHPQDNSSDETAILSAVGKLWTAGVAIDGLRLCGRERRRVSLPGYPFERQRYWVEPDEPKAPEGRSSSLGKRLDVEKWFYVPSWSPAAAASKSVTPDVTWLLFADESPTTARVARRLEAGNARVIRVSAGERFARHGDGSYVMRLSQRSDYDLLLDELQRRDLLPTRVAYLLALASKSTRGLVARRSPLAAYAAGKTSYFSVLFFLQAFGATAESMRIWAVTTYGQAAPGDGEVRPEHALMRGACKVIPHEYVGVRCTSVDFTREEGDDDETFALRVAGELEADSDDDDVVWRGSTRWVRRLSAAPLQRPATEALGFREGGVYLITGGLGGIGLAMAEHLAKAVRARLVLVSRTLLPAEGVQAQRVDASLGQKWARIRAMERAGAKVAMVAADVTDIDQMRRAAATARRRYGGIHGVIHSAGILHDELIALRPEVSESRVIDVKAKGALVLDAVTHKDSLDLFILFSSVSSWLGLPGQSDYTAANAFLDAFAHARSLAKPRQRTVSIAWNAWRDVGMVARRVEGYTRETPADKRVSSTRMLPGHPLLFELESDVDGITVFSTTLRRDSTWLLSEHVVRAGDAVLPGTAVLELARAALEHQPEARVVELRDVLFMAPFRVGLHQSRRFRLRIDRRQGGQFSLYGDSEDELFATGKAHYADSPPPRAESIEVVRKRCNVPGRVVDGQLPQEFMDFGPRWSCVRSIHLGEAEALISLELASEFAGDLETLRLHPALLDVATGGAQSLIPGFDADSFYVPFAYDAVLLRRALPRAVYSHVRLRARGARDSAIFDATLYSIEGEEIASVEGFVMRRVSREFVASSGSATRPMAPPASGAAVPAPNASDIVALREGITTAEGIDALERILASAPSPEIIASSVDMHAWLDRLQRSSEPTSSKGESAGAVFERPSLSSTYVAPRDDIESELAILWGDLLGVAQVGTQDDFFELGGQSLIAVRLFHRIHKKYGVELAMATLFQAPTIAQCAAILRPLLGRPSDQSTVEEKNGRDEVARLSKRQAPFRALVTLQAGGPHLLPFFCVHGAGGNVLKFRDLSRAMSRSQPFYGLQALGVDGVLVPQDSIEAMARTYLDEIRTIQPHGPYLLGGYSGGGVVAYEMSQLLSASGERVDLLAMLDTPNPRMPIRRVNRLSVWVGDGLLTRAMRLASGGVPYLVRGFKRQQERVRDLSRQAEEERTIAELRRRGETIPLALRELQLVRNFESAFVRYDLKPWQGKAVLFRASEIDFVFAEGGPCYGWDRHILGGVDVVEVPGTHHTLVVGANADVLARALSRAIERVQVDVATKRAS